LDSVSAYYYTGAVSVFAGVLFALALFLLTYPGYKEVAADRVVGRVGGLAAIAVALFPTTAPAGLSAPSWWHPQMAVVHHVAAVVLFVSFILFAIWLFRKSNVPRRQDRPLDKRRRDDICLACGILMIVAVLWAASSMVTHAPIFLPESIAIGAFAVSWLTKGEVHKPVMQMVRRFQQRVRFSGR
jgi:heme/copper-type cytochrome/quinol oxidase subunit 2